MAPAILLVDHARGVLRLLHAALDSSKHPEFENRDAEPIPTAAWLAVSTQDRIEA